VDDLLEALKKAGGKAVSGAALAKAAGVSRAAVHKRVERLRARGHVITGVNREGYRLSSAADVLDGGGFAEGWGKPFFHFEETGSTQEEAKARAAAGAPEGALFAAERQTAGRGRWSRRWESPAGGLWYSLVLRPAIGPAGVQALVLAAAGDWVEVLKARGVDAFVKEPNDVWVGKRKLAGVLAEMSSEPDRVQWVVLGVGMNVNNDPPKEVIAPSTSLKALTGGPTPRQDLLSAWMSRFQTTYARFR
jgi:BirA family transcriptional regulator, biotin operon repressor / biotin---[acetyl-CoA-carboxylase] ligase